MGRRTAAPPMCTHVLKRRSRALAAFRWVAVALSLIAAPVLAEAATTASTHSYQTYGGALLSVPASNGLLQNATTTAAAVTLTAAVATQPAHGAVVVNTDGSFIYAPD